VAEDCGLVGDPGLEASFETRVEEQALNLSKRLRMPEGRAESRAPSTNVVQGIRWS
jgi:hypothetical protein